MKLSVVYPYQSLGDYLNSRPLDVDGLLDDGWGAVFPVKGREIDAAILFADISGFSARTAEMSSTETLIYVNNFFSWMSAEGLRDTHGIVDKYIGDEMMVVFSQEFGSEDPVLDALRAARRMIDQDVLSFSPHIGIAFGRVTVGVVGTPLRFEYSTFGAPVALAKRCSSVPPAAEVSKCITLPDANWKAAYATEVFGPRKRKGPDGQEFEQPSYWTAEEPREVELKNIGKVPVRCLTNPLMRLNTFTVEDRARAAFKGLKEGSQYHPIRFPFEPSYPAHLRQSRPDVTE